MQTQSIPSIIGNTTNRFATFAFMLSAAFFSNWFTFHLGAESCIPGGHEWQNTTTNRMRCGVPGHSNE